VPLDLRGWNLAAGVRTGLACAVPLLLAEGLDRPELSWVAIVSFWGCLADPGGAWRTRLAALVHFTLCATCGAFVAVLLRPFLWPSVAFALGWCFTSSIARVWGDAAANVGSLSCVAYLVALGVGDEVGFGPALDVAELTLIGCLWAIVLALVVWRQHPHAPARRAVARVLHEVAEYMLAMSNLLRPGTDGQAWEHVARERRRACREAIETARRTLIETRRGRAGRSERIGHLLLILADTDQALARMIALNELLDSARSDTLLAGRLDRRLRVLLGRFAQGVDRVAATIEGKAEIPEKVEVDESLARLQRQGGEDMSLRRHVLDLLFQTRRWIGAAAEHAGPAGAPAAAVELPPPTPRVRPWHELRSNLSLDSLAFRHAMRLAITAAVAVLITHVFHIDRGFWVTITAVTILQPYLSTTWQRAIERVVATVLGGLLAAGTGMVLHRPIEIALLVIPLCVLTMAVRSVSFPLFILCLTPQFVLVAELFQPGGLNPNLAGVRSWDTVLGGILGLAATFLLWPYREGAYLGNRLAQAIRANRDYLLASLDAFTGNALPSDVTNAQRRAGLASNNAEASIQRLVNEPRRRKADEIGPALTSIAALRRLAGVAAALGTLTIDPATRPASDEVATLRCWLTDGLETIAATFGGGPPLPPLSAAPSLETAGATLLGRELERAGRQVLLLEETATRFAAAVQSR
jgi:uncharacterized membrane protein YccC